MIEICRFLWILIYNQSGQWAFFVHLFYLDFKLSVPPKLVYIPLDAQLSPPLFGIFKSVCWYEKFVFILVLSTRSVCQKWRPAMLHMTNSRKRCSRTGTISTRAILSHTMTEILIVCIFVRHELNLFMHESVNRSFVT